MSETCRVTECDNPVKSRASKYCEKHSMSPEGFGYWAGPEHEAEGHGTQQAVPMTHQHPGLLTDLDSNGYGNSTALGAFKRWPLQKEW